MNHNLPGASALRLSHRGAGTGTAVVQHGGREESCAARVLQRRERRWLGQTRFWGFTALYYGMLLESYADYDAASLGKPLRPIIPQELGVEFPKLPKLWPETSATI